MNQHDRYYPAQFAENTVEGFLAEFNERRYTLYWLILGLFAILFACLPFFKVYITIRANGVIRPASERVELVFRNSGFLRELLVKDNSPLTKGLVIARVESRGLEERLKYNREKEVSLKIEIADLEVLTQIPLSTTNEPTVKRASYLTDWRQYASQRKTLLLSLTQNEQEMARSEALVKGRLTSQADWDMKVYQVKRAHLDIENLETQYAARWQDQLTARHKELLDVMAESKQLSEEKELGTLVAPISGTLLMAPGLVPESFVASGTRLGEISPSDGLIAETYISPGDVAHLRKNYPARLQVDGFPYTEWGMLPGTVVDIASDFLLVGQQPLFKVRVQLNSEYLALANGIQARIQKGMTCQVRFPMTSRSLLQLLYENASQWLNPSVRPPPNPNSQAEKHARLNPLNPTIAL